MMKHNRILVVVGFFPYPCYFGGAIDVYGRIEALKELGYVIDMVCTCKVPPSQEDMAAIQALTENIYILERKNRITDMVYLQPLQATSRKSLKTVVLDQEYDLVILESESTAPILQNRTLKVSKIALRVHNNESKYFFQLGGSTGNIFKKLYYYIDAIKFKKYSAAIFAKTDRLWFISIDEMNECVKKGLWTEKAFHLPSSSVRPVQQNLGGRKVLFIGSMFMPNNINAIEWYLKNVHGQLLKKFPDYTFVVVGSTGDVKEDELMNMFSGYTNVEIHFNAPNLASHYAGAAVFVNPMQYGTGVKLKSLNAIANGLPLVSTHTGSEGIGLIDKEMFFRADSPADFYAAIEHIFLNSPEDAAQMVKKAQDFLNSNDYLTLLKKETDDLIKQA